MATDQSTPSGAPGQPRRKRRPNDPIFTPQEDADNAAAFRAGATTRQLASRHGCTQGTVRKSLARQGIRVKHWCLKLEGKHDEICRRYEGGEAAPSIARDFDVDPTAIYYILERRGVLRRVGKPPTPARLHATKQAIVDLVRGGLTIQEAGRRAGVTSRTFYSWMKKGKSASNKYLAMFRREIQAALGGLSAASRSARIYLLDERFFENIDHEDKAYILGLVITDGGINGNSLRIKLQAGDRALVEAVRDRMGSNAPVVVEHPRENICNGHVVRAGPQAAVTMTSQKLIDDLFRLGVTNNKTFVVHPWSGPPHLLPAFWRGVLDGDGTIAPRRRGAVAETVWQVSLVGNEHVVRGFAAFAAGATGFPCAVYPDGNIFQCQVRGGLASVQSLLRRLYPPGCLALARKKARAEQVLRTKLLRPRMPAVTAAEFLAAREQGGNWNAACRLLGIAVGSVQHLRERLGLL